MKMDFDGVTAQIKKRILFAVSLACLCQLKNYSILTSVFKGSNLYYHDVMPSQMDFLGIFFNLTLYAFLLFISSDVVFNKDRVSTLAKFLFSILLMSATCISIGNMLFSVGFLKLAKFYYIKNAFSDHLGLMILLVLLVLSMLFALVIRYREEIVTAFVVLVFILSPYSIILLGGTLRYAFLIAPQYKSQESAPVVKKIPAGKTKVVFILFDEWDYRLTFANRPAGIVLNEIDKLKSESVFFTNAYPPANNTLNSIPAITSGVMVNNVTPISKYDATLNTVNGEKTTWSKLPSLFRTLKNENYSSGVLGSFVPYCNVLGEDIDECLWYAQSAQENSYGTSLFEKLINQNRTLIESPRFSPFGQSLYVKEHIKRYNAIIADTMTMLSNDDHELVYLHLPIPHPPFIYNKSKGDLSLANNKDSGYVDELELVDRTIHDIRTLLNEKGMLNRVTLILTSDHWFRFATYYDGKKDHRVPLIIKFPDHNKGINYSAKINTVGIGDVIFNVVNGKICSPDELITYLSKNRVSGDPVEMPGLD